MPKRLRRDPIYIAPDILGQINENGTHWVFDQRSKEELNPLDPLDKVKIYERQVKEWFLEPANKLLVDKEGNNGFIVLMICLSYIEGVEEYKTGESSRNRSRTFFCNGLHRIYPNRFTDNQLSRFYDEARCGLFHNGMVRGQIIINSSFEESLSFPDEETIKVSPAKFLKDIADDFDSFLRILREDDDARSRFNSHFSNL